MIWLNPLALFALAAVAAPILIHILVQRRAERFPFPTLQFLQPTRLAAIRRHLLEDLALLAVRAALLAAAVAAVAGPLVVTPARRQAWDRRLVRAIVTDGPGVPRPFEGRDRGAESPAPHRQEEFAGASLADGIRRALVWLHDAPPARREIVVASTLAIGSITAADVAGIPADVGVRFERTGTLPDTRVVPAGRLLSTAGVRVREVTFSGDRTSSRETDATDPMTWPIEVIASPVEKPAIDAAVAAVLSQRVWAGPADRRARLVLGEATPVEASPVSQAWMADAVARMADDRDLDDAGARVTAGLSDARYAGPPWQVLASAADGRPVAVAAGSTDRLVVASAARAADIATAVLLRSIANSIVLVPDRRTGEVVAIADARLRQWSRPPAPLTSPRIETMDQDDRRWLWAAALILLALEMWMRRTRSTDAGAERREEHARVA